MKVWVCRDAIQGCDYRIFPESYGLALIDGVWRVTSRFQTTAFHHILMREESYETYFSSEHLKPGTKQLMEWTPPLSSVNAELVDVCSRLIEMFKDTPTDELCVQVAEDPSCLTMFIDKAKAALKKAGVTV